LGPQQQWDDGGVTVHQCPVRPTPYHVADSGVATALRRSQALYEGVCNAQGDRGFDILDVPLWAAQGFATLYRAAPVVLWLQTSTAQLNQLSYGESPAGRRMLAALEGVCVTRAAALLSDSYAALAAIHSNYEVDRTIPTAVAHLGLPVQEAPAERRLRPVVEALVVGRLERRKGTALLFDLLPDLLQRCPMLQVRFVGHDNSANDGWQLTMGADYPTTFRHRYPHLSDRVYFDGYVSETELTQRYATADLLVAPSLYESFGLVYLEAMRAGLPIATFAAGAAGEIFANGAADGALLAPAHNPAAFADSIAQLALDPQQRLTLGAAGRQRFLAHFSDDHMVDATLACYHEVRQLHQAQRRQARVIYQVMEALTLDDAVSTISRSHAATMADLGEPAVILAREAHPTLHSAVAPLQRAVETRGAGMIMHVWNHSRATWLLDALAGPRAIYYHNITPPAFFTPDTPPYLQAAAGYAQLAAMADRFDLILADSRYNMNEITCYIKSERPTLVIYPVVEAAAAAAAAYDKALLLQLQQINATHLLFVGRVAPNKRLEQIMQAFEAYCRNIDPCAHLWLVGDETAVPTYRRELEQLRQQLTTGAQIHFTGKVSAPALRAYYRAAQVFVCASAHEGFGIPLAEAMAHDLPVVAYAAAAVPETLGNSGVLVAHWDPVLVAEQIHQAVSHVPTRRQIIAGQHANLQRFSAAEARMRLAAAIHFLRHGIPSPLFEVHGSSASIQFRIPDG
ncbi:MAG TPA: glycosyltransferase, partial [Roseiflexaceae bacterium]|nr:glycosyltransferase [Roseiflexaceae bacterium]